MVKFWIRNMARPRNIVGPQVRRLRVAQSLSQAELAGRCQRAGWDISRETLAKIEAQIRWVADIEVVYLAKTLRVDEITLLHGARPRD
jgi:transcriptional regulator with XRE-family HTH domain